MATIQIPPDFREFLQLLNARKIECLVVGGYAVTYHGYPRSTGDIDVWVNYTPENIRGLALGLKDFGLNLSELYERIVSRGEGIGLGIPPLRIEILTVIDGVSFDDCYSARQTANAEGVEVSFLGLEDLRRNKRASGRAKELNDLEHLRDVK